MSNLFMYLLAFFNACHAGYGNRGCLKSHASEPRKIGAGGSKRSFSRPRDSLRSTLAILDWRVSSPAMLKLDIYTMKIRIFFVEILLLGKKINT